MSAPRPAAELTAPPVSAPRPAAEWTAPPVSAPRPAAEWTAPDPGDIEALLQELVSQLEPPVSGPRGRPPILPALCLWGGLLVCVLQGFSSQLALWRLLTQTGLWHFPRLVLSDQAIYHRLARDGTGPLEELVAQINTRLGERLAPHLAALGPELAPFASAVVALNETTLDPVARRLPSRTGAPPADDRHLPGKLAGLFDLRRQQWRTVELITDPHQNEKVAARSLVATLERGALILADLGYFSFPWFDELTDAGHFWISRLRAKTTFTVEHVFYEDGETLDALVWLGAYRADRAAHLVRLVQYRHGAHLHQYLTNVRSPARFSLAQIAGLYARRWDIEMAIQLVKQHLGLALWWSRKEVVIHQRLLAVLIIAQIVQALRLEIAARAGVEVFDVSLPLLVRYLPQFAARGEDPIAAFVARGRAAGFIRPSRRIRIEPPTPPPVIIWPDRPVTIRRQPRYARRKCGSRMAA